MDSFLKNYFYQNMDKKSHNIMLLIKSSGTMQGIKNKKQGITRAYCEKGRRI